jgi:16S rRNA (guanine(966)-N(2))-methyltransferase RsmD
MRIVSGKFRGKIIMAPKNLPVRPTTDLAKEALFNVLNNRVDFDDIKVLDLFCGTGNISYEFASRGAEDITCVDADGGCVRFVEKMAREMGFTGMQVVKSDAFRYLERAFTRFDVIFADPPFDMDGIDRLVDTVFARQLLREDGLFILEHSDAHSFKDHPQFVEERRYGRVHFSFFERETL